MPMNVAMQTFFVESMQKDQSLGKKTKGKLLSILQTTEVKENVTLATKVLQMLLLPGSRLCGEETILNLSGIQAKNLYLWNCVLSDLDLSSCAIDGFQVINAELNNINFQRANIRNMQVCSDVPIVGIAQWQNGRVFEVTLLLSNNQLLRYSIRDQFDSEHIEVKLLEKKIDDRVDGLFCLIPDIYLFQKKALYSHAKKLSELHSDSKLLQIKPIGRSMNYLLDIQGSIYVSCFTDNVWSGSYCFGKTSSLNVDSFTFISCDTFAFFREEKLFVRRALKEAAVWNMYDEVDCFCGTTAEDNSITLYLLSSKQVRMINVPATEGTITEKLLPIKMTSKGYKHVEPLNDWVLLATDETRAFLIKLYESGCEVTELASGVKCHGLLLGDAEEGNCVEDNTAYRLLSSMNS